MKENDNQAARIESIQILRALAFLGIFTSHCNISSLGPWGASVFFVLSGFLMVYRYSDRTIIPTVTSALGFSLKKIGKLYYLHIITMIAYLFIPVLFKGSTLIREIATNYKEIILNIFLLQSWIPQSKYYFSLNAVAWFLSDCLLLYAAFPFLHCFIKKIKSVKCAFCYMVTIFAVQIIIAYYSQFMNVSDHISDGLHKWLTYICPLYRLGDFCIGGLVGWVYIWMVNSHRSHNIHTDQPIRGTLLEVVAAIVFIFTQMIYTGEISVPALKWFRYSCLFLPSSLLLVWIFAREEGMITRTIRYNWLLFIGNYSAFAYLIHQDVIRYMNWSWMYLFNIQINTFIKVILSFSITMVLSVLFERHQKEVISRCKGK